MEQKGAPQPRWHILLSRVSSQLRGHIKLTMNKSVYCCRCEKETTNDDDDDGQNTTIGKVDDAASPLLVCPFRRNVWHFQVNWSLVVVQCLYTSGWETLLYLTLYVVASCKKYRGGGEEGIGRQIRKKQQQQLWFSSRVAQLLKVQHLSMKRCFLLYRLCRVTVGNNETKKALKKHQQRRRRRRQRQFSVTIWLSTNIGPFLLLLLLLSLHSRGSSSSSSSSPLVPGHGAAQAEHSNFFLEQPP